MPSLPAAHDEQYVPEWPSCTLLKNIGDRLHHAGTSEPRGCRRSVVPDEELWMGLLIGTIVWETCSLRDSSCRMSASAKEWPWRTLQWNCHSDWLYWSRIFMRFSAHHCWSSCYWRLSDSRYAASFHWTEIQPLRKLPHPISVDCWL